MSWCCIKKSPVVFTVQIDKNSFEIDEHFLKWLNHRVESLSILLVWRELIKWSYQKMQIFFILVLYENSYSYEELSILNLFSKYGKT